MTQVKGKFVEQAVNKFIEMVLARLVKAERLQVRVKANLKDLLAGRLDALTIQMFGFLLRRHLKVAEFQFDIGAAAVNLESVMRRQIELLYPSEGSVRMMIFQEQLTKFFNAELVSLSQQQQNQFQLQQVNCEFREDGAIAFHFQWISAEVNKLGTCIVIPQIETNGNTVVLVRQNVEGNELPAEFVNVAIAQLSEILSLNDIANRGTTFHIQQIDIEANKIIVQASTYIEQFPST